MRLPWVSRSELDYARANARTAYERLDITVDENARLLAAAERATARYESLVSRMLEMKREGFKTVPMLTEPLKPSESALAPEVEFEIEKQASGDPSLRRHLYRWAQSQTGLKADPASIVQGIRYGDEGEEEMTS